MKAFEDGKAQAEREGRTMENPEPEKTLEQGCATTVKATVDPSLDRASGAFLRDCSIATDTLKAHAKDEQKVVELWRLSEELVGERFLSEA